MRKTDRFEILETIQQGLIATTYRARDFVLDRTVLLKVLHPGGAHAADIVQRFRREAMLQARLRHPNIVTVYEFGTEEELYIASEFVEGTNLEQLLERQGPMSEAHLGPIITQVARALSYAHSQGIVHRDIKPANILIALDGHAKLADFGLAFARDLGQLTQEGCVVGTPSYMSPEQARGRRTNEKTDLFSLGVVIYRSLTGINPFAADTFADSMSLVLNRTPRPVSELASAASPGVSALVARLLSKDPKDRTASLDEVIRAFSPIGEAVRQRPRTRLLPVAAGVIATIAVVLLVAKSRPAAHTMEMASTAAPAVESAASTDSFTTDRPVETASRPAPQTAPVTSPEPAEPALQRGRIKLAVRPWAEVYVDGRLAGTTPLGEDLMLKRGVHVFEFRHPDFPILRKRLRLADSVASYLVDLDSEVAFVEVVVNPWAAVAIDGRPVDTTPFSKPIALSLGEHLLTLTHPLLGTRSEKITTDTAGSYRFSFTMAER